MSDTLIEEKPANPKADEWVERIAAQQRSGMSVKQFCKEHGLTEYSFYAWRKRLQEKGPVRYLLELQPEVLPKSPSGAAVRYALNQWVALTRLLNTASWRLTTVLRNGPIATSPWAAANGTFFGSDGGGKTAAVLRSFIAFCKRCGVEPFAWFPDVLSRIPAKRTTAPQLGTRPRRDHRFRSFG
jgi:transposase-like protein